MKMIKYDLNNLDFDKDWNLHKKCREWWYATGILFDDDNNMYSYQYTLLSLRFGPLHLFNGMIAFTDYKNNKHYYLQDPTLNKKKLIINDNEATYINVARAIKQDDGFVIELNHKDFNLNLKTEYNKGAFWHCDNGKLQMGLEKEDETTLYYSYTNMPTVGSVIINGQEISLKGKTWFDRQGGTYTLTNPETQWEWFSLRFFDDEEIMLFTFNDVKYNDGTYINNRSQSSRLNDYKIKRTSQTVFNNMKWSNGWEINVGVKDDFYKIEPIQEGHINFLYFEELCHIKDKNDKIVGYAFAELLPAILNDIKSIQSKTLFKRIEF